MRVYNTKVESVPSSVIANMFKFEKATYFQVDEPAVRQAPDVNFGEIAYRAGYGDQLYFSRAFKRQFAEAPSAYRERMRGRAPDR